MSKAFIGLHARRGLSPRASELVGEARVKYRSVYSQVSLAPLSAEARRAALNILEAHANGRGLRDDDIQVYLREAHPEFAAWVAEQKRDSAQRKLNTGSHDDDK